ncbi:MAG TPA: protein kinase [Kofleriaceae bacterium]|nr:protein kinase [Kofleriaceae bacterium]
MSQVGAASAGAASNQYQILGHLATGGMAELYLARAVGIAGFERYVVLKRIMAEHSRNHRFVTMFLDEARLAAQLHHPNIAQVYDIGRVSDSYFFTLEYVHGENCRDLLQRVAALKRQIPIEHTLTIIAGAAAGLHYAHEKRGIDRQPLGIVHRDVSPSNLMVSYEGAIKLVDFGIAKAAHRMTETRSGAVKGKVAYMSPEQCTGAPLDRRSDIFSLGIVLYEMATMTRLFKFPTDFETMTHIVNKEVPPPSSRRPEISRELEAIILRCLAKKPEDRFQSGEELLEAIEDLAASQRLSLSAMTLGRYIRELFGERPEPWYELEAAGDHTGLVTIETTSAEELPPEAFGAGSTKSQWQAGLGNGREWLPGSGGAQVVSAVSVLAPDPAIAALPVIADAPTLMEPVPRAERMTGPIEKLSLPLPPPELDSADDMDPDDIASAATIVGPVTGALLLQQPLMRDTPDREPSWGSGEHDPSWSAGSAGSGVEAMDLRPRRRWILWSALASGAIGLIIILVAASGGGESAGAAAVEPSANVADEPAEGDEAAAKPPTPTPAPTPALTQPPAPTEALPQPPAPTEALTQPPAPPTPTAVVDEPPPVTRQAPPPPVTRQKIPPTRTTTAGISRTRTRPPRTTTTSTPPPSDKVKKPPAKCGGLYPPCD